MKKILSTLAIIFLSLPILLQTAIAHDALAKPEDQVSAFYRWYIQKQSGHTFPLLDHEISKYVAEPTIKRLRSDYKHGTLPGDADYFTKVQDYDEQDWLHSIRPANPIALCDVTVVPVTFGSKDRVNVLVFLKQGGTGWKIIKVDDTWGYQ